MSHAPSRRMLLFIALAACMAASLLAARATAQTEPNGCLSQNPADWPAPAKPYFLIAFDTSGSMTTAVASGNSCNYPNNRLGHGRCAVRNTVQAFSQANFGLISFARELRDCTGTTCGTSGGAGYGNGCNAVDLPNASSSDVGCSLGSNVGCGPEPTEPGNSSDRRGGNMLEPIARDNFWDPVPDATNVPSLLQWVDNDCSAQGLGGALRKELFASGCTPLNGILRDAFRYLSNSWTHPGGSPTFASPLGTLAQGERPCRSVNVILVTDGDETCDPEAHAVNAAAALANGFTRGGITWRVPVSVICFGGGCGTGADDIADAGDDGNSTNNSANAIQASNEVQLSQALSNIVSSRLQPEVCNNTDDNCNGCTDEGWQKWCNRGKTAVASPTQPGQCCNWTNATQRSACITGWQGTVSPAKPLGDQWRLPCWNPAVAPPGGLTVQQAWLCSDPGEVCDNADNNCDATCTGSPPNVQCGFQNLASPPNQNDEGFTKCGSPLQCPVAETCDGQDNDCDGIVDNAAGNPSPFSLPGCNPCVPSQEICNGCDDDCDGVADNGITPIPCGFTQQAPCGNVCAGTRSCGAATPVATPGACLPGFPANRLGSCNASGGPEACNGCDDNCDGLIDNGIPPTVCDVPGMPGLNYGPNSQCRRGMQPCNGTCTGFVGPSAEVCDGIDNNCNGQVDENVPGVGIECGSALGQCRKGTTACVAGVIVCQGGTPPQPETCNGLDDDCDGTPDDAPLADAPTNTSCWNLGGTCTPQCSHAGFNWCPPTGATCTGTGTLTLPCKTGTLACDGLNGWRCVGGTTPSPEVCDGGDNDCNGSTDENLGSPIGDSCGSNVGECRPGTNICDGGNVVCDGEVGPSPEVCDGKDNDCDGTNDNGIPLGSACDPPYDTTLYPGDRTKGECRPGNLQCDMMGNTVCVNGIGPQPEICDGKDNDCDGQTDEVGPPPDGINGTTNPMDSTQKIGDSCGTDVGECRTGRLGCTGGRFVCLGAVGPQPETCDCADNDCDGVVDNGNGDAGPALCSTGKTCVDTGPACVCAEPCGSGEFKCPTGSTCRSDVTLSGTMTPAGDFCIPLDPCGDCSTKTAFSAQSGAVECGPAGTQGPFTPVCVCKGQFGCHSPCFNVTCPSGLDCVGVGPLTGRCEDENNCNLFGCDAGQACRGGVCVASPCEPNPCSDPTPVCKPDSNFDPSCVGSCAGVDCAPGERCRGGTCEPTGCGADCNAGETCKPDGDGGFACGPSACTTADGGLACPDGSYCDPVTGACGDHPCTGVSCPGGQVCADGECVEASGVGGSGGMPGVGGSSGGGAVGGTGGTSAGGTSQVDGSTASGGSGTNAKEDRGVFGLATGGGGCACRTTAPDRRSPALALALAGLALAGWRRRRARCAPGSPASKGGA